MTTPTHAHQSHDVAQVAPLVVGDLVAMLVFAAVGRRSHGEAAGIAALVEVVYTAAPFALAWFIMAPWFGAFRQRVVQRPATMAQRTGLAWLAALPVGLLLRALFIGRFSPLSFAVVTFLVILVLLVGWRSVYGWVKSKG